MVTYAAASLTEAPVSLRKFPTFTPALLRGQLPQHPNMDRPSCGRRSSPGEMFLHQQSRNVVEKIDHPFG